MKIFTLTLSLLVLVCIASSASAAVLYVDSGSPNPTSPFATWSVAATNIQDAIDAANDGDLVLVTNGIYQTGGRVIYGSSTNRVAVTKAITLQSVNGPQATFIVGAVKPGTIPPDGIRCVYLTNGATLSGFTLTNGAARQTGDAIIEKSGGGVWCEDSTSVITNCVLINNSAGSYGGGAFRGMLVNSTLITNNASWGGGAASNTLISCTLLGNRARFNNFNRGGGVYFCTLSNCTVSGNTCISFGTGGGAYSSTLNDCTISNNFAFGDGGGLYYCVASNCLVSSNRADRFGGGGFSNVLNNCVILRNVADQGGGVYNAKLLNCTVAANSAATFGGGACSSILTGCTISNNFATNAGGGLCLGSATNCLISSNRTIYYISYGGGTCSNTLNNCVIQQNRADHGGAAYQATLINCTLTANSADSADSIGGTAAYATLNGCLIQSNRNCGAIYSTLDRCTLVNNAGPYGGGAYRSILRNCILSRNTSESSGGGGYASSFTNCLLISNSCSSSGGGAGNSSFLANCTVISNIANRDTGVDASCGLQNCIVYYNAPGFGTTGDYTGTNASNCCINILPPGGINNFTNPPLLVDIANGNFHLQSNSPCINAGNNAAINLPTDLDSNPRIVGGTVDVGCYEFQSPASQISYAWLARFGLPADGSGDSADFDGDGLTNWQEWRARTDPTNSASTLNLVPLSNSVSSVTLQWQSVTDVSYFIQRATDLSSPTPFSTIQANINGQNGTTSFNDTSAPAANTVFYRIGVQ